MERKIKKNKKMNRRAPCVREQKKGVAACPRVCQQEDGSHIPAKRREMVSSKREKTRRKKNEPKGRGGVSQNVGREEGASKREVREKMCLEACREGWGGVVSQNEGEIGKGNLGGRSGAQLRVSTRHKVNRGNIPKQCHICHVTHCESPLHAFPSFPLTVLLSTGT